MKPNRVDTQLRDPDASMVILRASPGNPEDANSDPNAPIVDLALPRTVDELAEAVAMLDGATVVSCDVETTGFSPIKNELLSVAIGALYDDGGGLSVVVPRELVLSEDPQVQDYVWHQIYRVSRRTVGQNYKFDLAFLSRWFNEDVPQDAFLGDTLLMGYLLDERPRKDRIGSLGLKEQAMVRYDYPDYHWDWDFFYNAMSHDGTYPGRPRYGCERYTNVGKKVVRKCKYLHPGDVAVIDGQEVTLPDDFEDEERADWMGMYTYQAKDVYFTIRMWRDQLEEAGSESAKLLEAHDNVLMPAAKTLAQCFLNGAPLDREWIHKFSRHLRRRMDTRERSLAVVAAALGVETIDLASPAQIADAMYDLWKITPDMRRKTMKQKMGGEDRSTDKDHIEAAIHKYWRSPNATQRKAARWLKTLLKWRGDAKMMSTYSESLLARADPDGRIRADFLIHGTSTGRLSSSGPNLQNIPAVQIVNGRYVERRSGKPTAWPARRAFAPANGRYIAEADFGQLELRVAAALSGDSAFTRVFVEGRDIHLEVAATMFSKPPEQISKPERFLAKAVDFGILYGRTAKALVNGVEMDFLENELHGKRWDEPTAQAFINKFLRGYPQLAEWIERTKRDAIRDHYVESPFGRRRRFPLGPRTKYEMLTIERQAVNTPVQSAASDLCLIAMRKVAARLPAGDLVLFPVHDSIVLEFDVDHLEVVRQICQEDMEQVFMGVPMAIDFEYGSSWADVH